MSTGDRSLWETTVGGFRCSWKKLVLADVACKIIAFMALTPLVGILFQVLVAVSGRSVLADQDIVYFLLGPVGWICFIAVGGLWLGIVALEQAALLGIVGAAAGQRRMGVRDALRFAVSHARPILSVTARLLAWTLLVMVPFVVLAGLVYLVLLSQHDINFYLTHRPPVFLVALGLGGVLVTALVGVLLRLATNWFFALPLVLFEGVAAANALRISRERATGRRRTLLLWVAGWAVASIVFSAVVTSVVLLLGQLLVPHADASLGLLLIAIGLTLIVWAGSNVFVNLLSTTAFAVMLFNLYRECGSRGDVDLSALGGVASTEGSTSTRLTPARLIAGAVVGVLLAATIGAFAVKTVRLEDKTQIMAHRGASADAPENTMAAVKQAIDDGADWVEIDVQETADGEVVVFHDSDFMRLSNVKLNIWDATMGDLKDLDIGSWFDSRFRGERVPTLSEVLDQCKGKIRVNVELKYYGHDKRLEQRVAELVEAHEMESEIVIMSLKKDAVKKMKSLRPKWKVGLLTSVAMGDLTRVEADFLAVSTALATRRFVRLAHASGKEVYVWTVNDAPTMSSMTSLGADVLITDKPALARSVLQWRAQMSPPERMLLDLAGLLGVTKDIREQ